MAGPLLLVGCGKMGGAMLAGWCGEGGPSRDIYVVEPAGAAASAIAARGATPVADAGALPPGFSPEVVVLAVKPQVMADVLPAYRPLVAPGTVFLSIAAGTTLAFFARVLGDDAAVVRAMPNTPAAIGRGMTAAVANRHVSDAQRDACRTLLEAVGRFAWVEEEGQLDAVTGVSGSGPAYVFHMIECLAEAGVAAGLPRALAEQLARETVTGAGALAAASEESPATLRENVTSPNGTTFAGLQVLMAPGDGLAPLMRRTVAAATARSRELAG